MLSSPSQPNDLVPVLDLGMHPLCDDLVPIGDERRCKEYPIEVLLCQTCKTAHQRYQLPKEVLFPADYHYRAKYTKDVTDGLENFAQSVDEFVGGVAGKTVLDIGCNDGILLDCFKQRGAETIGIEPTDAGIDAGMKGHCILESYFPTSFGGWDFNPNVITFTNSFAHLEDLQGAIAELRGMIGPNTTIVIENHYLGSILDRHQFDTFYHEHPRTYSVKSFRQIADALGLAVKRVEFPKRYGGNVRVFLGQPDKDDRKRLYIMDAIHPERFTGLREAAYLWRDKKRQEILACGQMPAIAFPGRASILIRLLGLDERHISAVYQKDGSPKVGHYVPGTRIPILSDAKLKRDLPAVLNLAWHIASEVREHLALLGCKARVIDIMSEDDFCTPLLGVSSEAMATTLR